MFDEDLTGIVIEQYSSIANVVKVMRKYTDDSMADIRNHVDKKEFVLSSDSTDHSGIRRIVKCAKDLDKAHVTYKIIEDGEKIDLQLLKNFLGTSRDIHNETEAEIELETTEIEMSELEPFSYLWEEKQDDYVVIKNEYEYTIYNIKDDKELLFDDEDLNNAIASMMIMEGNRVIDEADND